MIVHQPTLLSAASEPSFRAEALADYFSACADEYQNFLNLMAEATDFEPTEETPDVQSFITAKLSEYGYAGTESVTLNDGFSTIRDVLQYIAEKTEEYASLDEDGASAITDLALQLHNCGGQLTDTYISVDQIINQTKDALHSAVVTSAAFAVEKLGSVAERLTAFNDRVQDTFQNAWGMISNTGAYMKQLIRECVPGTTQLTDSIMNSMDYDSHAADDDFTVSGTDFSQFTGTSPIAVVDLEAAKTVVSGVGKVVGAVVKGIFNGIGTVVKTVFTKIGNKINNIIEPYDIAILDDSSSNYSVDGVVIESRFGGLPSPMYNQDSARIYMGPDFDPSDENVASVINNFNRHAESWIKYKTIFGEILFKYARNSLTYAGSVLVTIGSEVVRRYCFDCSNAVIQYKPYAININALKTLSPSLDFSGYGVTIQHVLPTAAIKWESSLTYDNMRRWLEACQNLPDLYLDVSDTNEWSMYRGLQMSLYIMECLFVMQANEMRGDDILKGLSSSFKTFNDNSSEASPTNKMFMQATTGWNGVLPGTGDDRFGNVYMPNSLFYNVDISATGWNALVAPTTILLLQSVDRTEHPLAWTFLPYRDNVASFDRSRFRIKTNAENQAAMTTFCTVVFVVAVAALVLGTIALKCAKFARKMYWKRQYTVHQLDQAMWNGTPLTGFQKFAYNRANKKLSVTSMVTSGLQSGGISSIGSLFSSGDGTIPSDVSLLTKMIAQ